MNTNGRYIEQDPTREWVRRFVADVAAGGPGGTYGLVVGRYVVGGFATAWVIPAGANSAQRVSISADFAGRCAGKVHGTGLGYWQDSKTGRTWLDVVQATNSETEALTWALDNGEQAIYDRNDDRVYLTQGFLAEVARVWGQAE